MFISFIIFPTILDDSVTSGSNMKTIDINQNDVNHEMKNEIDTYYEDGDHYAPNNLDEEADDMVKITINGIYIYICVFNINYTFIIYFI